LKGNNRIHQSKEIITNISPKIKCFQKEIVHQNEKISPSLYCKPFVPARKSLIKKSTPQKDAETLGINKQNIDRKLSNKMIARLINVNL